MADLQLILGLVAGVSFIVLLIYFCFRCWTSIAKMAEESKEPVRQYFSRQMRESFRRGGSNIRRGAGQLRNSMRRGRRAGGPPGQGRRRRPPQAVPTVDQPIHRSDVHPVYLKKKPDPSEEQPPDGATAAPGQSSVTVLATPPPSRAATTTKRLPPTAASRLPTTAASDETSARPEPTQGRVKHANQTFPKTKESPKPQYDQAPLLPPKTFEITNESGEQKEAPPSYAEAINDRENEVQLRAGYPVQNPPKGIQPYMFTNTGIYNPTSNSQRRPNVQVNTETIQRNQDSVMESLSMYGVYTISGNNPREQLREPTDVVHEQNYRNLHHEEFARLAREPEHIPYTEATPSPGPVDEQFVNHRNVRSQGDGRVTSQNREQINRNNMSDTKDPSQNSVALPIRERLSQITNQEQPNIEHNVNESRPKYRNKKIENYAEAMQQPKEMDRANAIQEQDETQNRELGLRESPPYPAQAAFKDQTPSPFEHIPYIDNCPTPLGFAKVPRNPTPEMSQDEEDNGGEPDENTSRWRGSSQSRDPHDNQQEVMDRTPDMHHSVKEPSPQKEMMNTKLMLEQYDRSVEEKKLKRGNYERSKSVPYQHLHDEEDNRYKRQQSLPQEYYNERQCPERDDQRMSHEHGEYDGYNRYGRPLPKSHEQYPGDRRVYPDDQVRHHHMLQGYDHSMEKPHAYQGYMIGDDHAVSYQRQPRNYSQLLPNQGDTAGDEYAGSYQRTLRAQDQHHPDSHGFGRPFENDEHREPYHPSQPRHQDYIEDRYHQTPHTAPPGAGHYYAKAAQGQRDPYVKGPDRRSGYNPHTSMPGPQQRRDQEMYGYDNPAFAGPQQRYANSAEAYGFHERSGGQQRRQGQGHQRRRDHPPHSNRQEQYNRHGNQPGFHGDTHGYHSHGRSLGQDSIPVQPPRRSSSNLATMAYFDLQKGGVSFPEPERRYAQTDTYI